MMKKPKVIGLGEVLWDMLPSGNQLGGAPANVAFHAMQLGADALVVSAIGDDELGVELANTLSSMGLQHLLQQSSSGTGTVGVHLEDGIPMYSIKEGVAWDEIRSSNELDELARTADAVCFGTLAQRNHVSRETIQLFLSRLSPEAICLCDLNLRQQYYTKETIIDSLKACNVLKINDYELDVLSSLLRLPAGEEAKLQQLAADFSLNIIALTKGSEGSLLYTADELSHFSAKTITVADTIGAGDSFSAALIMGLIQKKSLRHMHEHATRISAYVCQQHGAMPVLPKELIY